MNVDLMERAEMTPDTVIRTVDGSNYVVSESIEEVIGKVIEFKAAVLSTASLLDADLAGPRREVPGGSRPQSPSRRAEPSRSGSDRLHIVPDEASPDPERSGPPVGEG